MKRRTSSPREDKGQRIHRLLRRSAAAWRIVESRPAIERHLREKPRKVWPTATIARLFGISPGLLRKWVDLHLLPAFRRPSRHHRPGLTQRSVLAFLRALAGESELGVQLARNRRRPAREKCLKAVRELGEGEVLTPAEFAARAGVAASTVIRLLADRRLEAWYPTPHRPKICHWRVREQKKKLTRKRAKKG